VITPLAIPTTAAKFTRKSDALGERFAPLGTGIAHLNEWIATGLDQQRIDVRGPLGDDLLPIDIPSYMPDGAAGFPKDPELHRRRTHPGELITPNWQLQLPLVPAWSFSVLDQCLDAFGVRTRKTTVPILVGVGEGPAVEIVHQLEISNGDMRLRV
jgi:hypothetical protein